MLEFSDFVVKVDVIVEIVEVIVDTVDVNVDTVNVNVDTVEVNVTTADWVEGFELVDRVGTVETTMDLVGIKVEGIGGNTLIEFSSAFFKFAFLNCTAFSVTEAPLCREIWSAETKGPEASSTK